MKLNMVTSVLGLKASSMLHSPYLVFSRTVSEISGPRFSFIKQYMPENATRWLPSYLLRSKDRVRALLIPETLLCSGDSQMPEMVLLQYLSASL